LPFNGEAYRCSVDMGSESFAAIRVRGNKEHSNALGGTKPRSGVPAVQEECRRAGIHGQMAVRWSC